MVPDDYHDFFIGTVTVAAALVGLLFVALSVHPGSLSNDSLVAMRVRATSALLAFLDALFISLVALLPNGSIGSVATGIGTAGTLSMVTLLVAVLVRRRQQRWNDLIQTLLLVVGQGVAYVWQIVGGVRLRDGGSVANGISLQATLILVFFVFGVFRAWEYVGGPRTGILGTVDELRHRPAAPAHAEPAHAAPAHEAAEAAAKPAAEPGSEAGGAARD